MTTLKVTLNDQRLIAEERVVIASGDINSVSIEVTFDESWNDYPHRYATFETTAMNGEPIEVVLNDGKGVVPHEVVESPGVLLVGVWASSLDGEDAKTSTYAKYKISQGARRSVTTLTPTMDLYRQFLASLNDKFSPMQFAFQLQLDEFIQQYETTLERVTERFLNHSGVAKVTVSTYKGDGSHGSSHPNRIPCDKKPAMVIINCPKTENTYNRFIIIHCNGNEIANGDSALPAFDSSGVCLTNELDAKLLTVTTKQTSVGDGMSTFDKYEVEWYGTSVAEQGNKDGVIYTYTIISC